MGLLVRGKTDPSQEVEMYTFGCVFQIICALLLPLGLGLLLCLKRPGSLRPLSLGAACFVLFQLVLRLPLLSLLGRSSAFTLLAFTRPWLYGLFMGLSAGLFEELGRYIVMSLFLKNRGAAADALAFGLGHGGIEAVLLVGLNALALLFMPPMAEATLLFAGGIERLSAMTLHICWSFMVMKSVKERRPRWLLLALALHSLADTATVWAGLLGASVWTIEAALLLAAVLTAVIVFRKSSPGQN